METQLAMTFAHEAQARSRHDDPETSKIAARRHEASGVAAERRAKIRKALVAAGRPCTPAEIAELADLDYYEVQRRLSEVQSLGWAKPVRSERDPFEALKVRCPIRGTVTRLWRAA